MFDIKLIFKRHRFDPFLLCFWLCHGMRTLEIVSLIYYKNKKQLKSTSEKEYFVSLKIFSLHIIPWNIICQAIIDQETLTVQKYGRGVL